MAKLKFKIHCQAGNIKSLKKNNHRFYKNYVKPINIEIKENEKTNVKLYNRFRNINFDVIKKDDQNQNYINGAKFSLYDVSKPIDNTDKDIEQVIINDIEDKEIIKENKRYPIKNLYIAKRNHIIDLTKLFSMPSDLFLLIDENKLAYTVESSYKFNNNHHFTAYVLKETSQMFDLNNNNRNFDYGTDFNQIKCPIKKSEELKDLELLNQIETIPGIHLLTYKFNYNNHEYLMLEPINYATNEILDGIKIYQISGINDLYIINDDNSVLTEEASRLQGIKIREETSGLNQIQVINPLKHNYYLPNYEIELFDQNDMSIGKFKSNSLGYIDVKELKEGSYYYLINSEKINVDYATKNGQIRLPYLLQNRQYLLVEDNPAIGYGFTNCNPVIKLDGQFNLEQINQVYENKNYLMNYNFVLFKTNATKEIKLNNAEFDAYIIGKRTNNQFPVDQQADSKTENKYLGRYQSGCLNINQDFTDSINQNDEFLLRIYRLDNQKLFDYRLNNEPLIETKTLIKEIAYQDNLSIEHLEEGNYIVELYNKTLEKETGNAMKYRVIKGGFEIKDIPYTDDIKLIETKAPQGYYKNNQPMIISSNKKHYARNIYNYRINQMIIINTKTDEK